MRFEWRSRSLGDDAVLAVSDEGTSVVHAWAADPQRGDLLPEGFHNPFMGPIASRSVLRGDPLAEPDITLHMAIDLVNASDRFQLRLLVPMILFGLRAAEIALPSTAGEKPQPSRMVRIRGFGRAIICGTPLCPRNARRRPIALQCAATGCILRCDPYGWPSRF